VNIVVCGALMSSGKDISNDVINTEMAAVALPL